MTVDKDLEAARDSEPLYAWWLNTIATLLGGSDPKAFAPAGETEPLPFPVGQVGQALQLTQQLLGPIYHGYLQTLLAHPDPGAAFVAFQERLQGELKKASDALGSFTPSLASSPALLSTAGWNLMKAPMDMFGRTLEPLSLNLERAYGGLADAFGLAPSREPQSASREMASAAMAKQQAQAEYFSLVVGALAKGSEGVLAQLKSMGERGETVDTLLALVRLWSQSIDSAMHVAMQSPKALEASAKLVRAGARSRLQRQRIVAIASESLNIPTRAEVDDAYREIQELKRELRRLRKAVPAAALAAPRLAVVTAEQDASARPAPSHKRSRAAAPKRKTLAKGTT